MEGRRELEHCLAAGFQLRTLFVCPEICPDKGAGLLKADALLEKPFPQEAINKADALLEKPFLQEAMNKADAPWRNGFSGDIEVGPLVVEIPEVLYRKVAYRESTEGIIAEVAYKSLELKDLHLPENPLVMVLESVEKPGNLGAVLRSADAARADAVLVCDPLTDLYNPNLIRASIGAVFTVPTIACSSEDAIRFLQANGIQILTAQLQDSSLYYDTDMRRGTALVMGTESTGLTDSWRKAATAHIRIPMLGRLDSLNVSVSAAILLFEAVRQRQGGAI